MKIRSQSSRKPCTANRSQFLSRNFVLAVGLILAFVPVSGYAQSYSYRRTIAIDHTKVPNTDQANFPVAISGTYSSLATVANGGRVRSANGYDIIFTSDVLGTAKLDHEIESYDPITGKVNFWVRIPTLSHTTDTTIYMQYGSDTVTTSQENKTGVWDANFQAVWHLQDGTTLSSADSTSQGHNGTVNGATATTGVIDGAGSFSGASQYIDVGNMGARPIKGTISMWVKAPALANYPNTFTTGALGGSACGNGAFRFELNSSGVLGAVTGNSCSNINGPAFTQSFTSGQWHHLAVIWDSSTNTETSYYDGISAQTIGNTFWPANFDAVKIGVGFDTTRYWNGQIDEVRMSNSVRSGDWVATEYNNQNTPATFYSVGGENAVGITISPATAMLYGGQAQQFTAAVANSTNTAVTWTISPSGTGSVSSAGLYTAPATVSSQQTVTVTATSVADATKSASSVVTLKPPIAVSAAPAAVTLMPSQAQQFTASLTNTSNTAVTWSISPVGSGSISPAGLYIAPATISAQQTVTVTATSAVDTGKSGSATVTLSPASGVFTYRRPIVIDHTKIPNTDQSNFPVLISGTYSYLATTANGGKVQSTSGYDIIFTSDAAGTMKLDHEIENYDPVTGKVNFWVRVPALSHAADTVIYLQYGDAAVTASLENKTGVWDSNYRGVWHLGNGSSLNVLDSTSGANHGSNSGATAGAGQIGGAALLNGTSQFIGIGSLGATSNSSALTLSAWARPNSASGVQKILSLTGTTTTQPGTTLQSFVANLNAANGKFVAEAGKATANTDDATDTAVFNTSQWYYVSGTFGAGKVTLYVNGVKKAATSYNAATTLCTTNNNGWSIGKYVENGTDQQWWNGSVDEVRVSNAVRTPDWISAEYNNQNSPSTFYSLGAENTVVVTISPVSIALYAGQTQQFAAPTVDAINPAVTWSIAPSGTGSISSAGLYTAPSSIGTQQTVTVTATSVQDNTKTASATVTLYPPASVSVTPASPALYSSQTQQFSTVVANAPTQGVTWSISPAGLGAVSSSGLYTAPGSINAQQTVTVTATSVADPTKTGSATITLGQESQVYGYRRAITIDHTKVPNTDQSNFPVLISGTFSYLATVANGGKVQSANGYDIIFTNDAPGSTKLDHEIESYNPATGAISFWVRIPVLSHITDTVIYVQYGSSAITTSQENKAGVWDSGYKGVWHLGNGTSLNVSDSTSNANNGTNNGATAISGEIGGGASFNGSSQFIGIGPMGTMSNSSTLTLSAWAKPSSSSGVQRIVALTGSSNSFAVNLQENGGMFVAQTGKATVGGDNATDTSSFTTGQWYYVLGTFDGGNVALYVNGAKKSMTAYNNATSSVGSTNGWSIGKYVELGADYQWWNGSIDEVRLSSVVRSSDWIAAEYNNQSSPSSFYVLGTENLPLIRSLSPSSGKPGASITLSGANFGSSAGTVKFNGTTATTTSWSDTSIVAVVPNGATSGPVVVTSSGALQGNGVSFTVLAPAITSLTPNRGPAGTSVTISGTSFGASAGTVAFNSHTATTSSWSDTSIVAVVPTSAGMGNVVVTNGGIQSNGVMFGGPFIGSLNPSSGLTGTSVTISGSNFGTTAGSVAFGTANAAITSWSDTSIVVTVPASALSGLVAVTVQGVQSNGVSFSVQEQVVNGAVSYSYDELGRLVGVVAASGDAATYNYDAVGNILSIVRTPSTQPTVLSFSPTSGPVGTQVTISGSNFSATAGNDTVKFNGTTATISSASTTQLVVTVPSGATTGTISVTAPAGMATSSNSFTVTSSSGKPSISSFTPQIVAPGGSVTISGANFDTTAANDRLKVNTTAVATPSSVTSSSMVMTAPSSFGSGHIYLSTPAGYVASSGDLFFSTIPSQVVYTGRAALGSPTTVSIPTSGRGLLLFDGSAGQPVSISLSSSNFTFCVFNVWNPDRTSLGVQQSCQPSSTFIDAQILPLTGTYMMEIVPDSGLTGSVIITVNDATSAFNTISSGGGGTTVSTTAPGENAKLSFAATGGQQVSVQFSSNTYSSVTASLLAPDKTVVTSMTSSSASFSFPTLTLPSSGTYTIFIDPAGTVTGSIHAGLTLQGSITSVPLRPVGSVLDSGNALSTSLVGLFLMNEGIGGTDKNLVDGQLANFAGTALPLWRTSDPSIAFQGGTSLNSYLDAGADLSFDQLTPGQMTVVAKVLVRAVAAAGIAEKNDSDVDSGFVFGFDNIGALRLTVEKTQANMQAASASGIILPGQWVQLAFTWDGTTGTAASAHLFLNGVEQTKATAVDGAGTIGFANATGKSFRIGNAAFDFPGSLDGRIAYVAVYKGRILSPTELGQLDAQLPIH